MRIAANHSYRSRAANDVIHINSTKRQNQGALDDMGGGVDGALEGATGGAAGSDLSG